MTQRQEINEMSNLEFAVFLKAIADGDICKCDICIYDDVMNCTEISTCTFGIEKWLKSEVTQCPTIK